MGSKGIDGDAMISRIDGAECSETTTVEIKIKTLDSQTYTLRVNKRMPVLELKEQIETVTGVVSAQQRLICRGKVLKDDQLLSTYHVEDGHTLHLVVRQPHPPSSGSTMSSMGSESLPTHAATDPASSTGYNRGNQIAHSVVLGTFNVGDHGDGGMPDLNRIVSAVLSSIGITNVGVGSEGMDLRDSGPAERLDRISAANNMLDSTRLETQHPPHTRTQFDSLPGTSQLPTAASLDPLQPSVIPDSLTTLSQYLIHLKNEFSANGRGQSSNACAGGIHGSERREHNSATLRTVGVQGLPTPASLAEVMLSTRQMLIEQAGVCLSHIARQLEDQVNVTNLSVRSSIQTSAMGTGVLLQNLGAMLLELGRTTMTLRMGQTPSEAVVNAGPAVFISTSGPNPIMVQPLPFQPGMGFGAFPMGGSVNPGSGLVGGTLGSGLFPRNIDIRIRTGTSMSTPNVNQDEQDGPQQTPGVTDPSRTSDGANSLHQAVSGVPSFTRDSGVRMVPIRTVVAAIPSAVNRSTSDSSGSSVGLFHPLLARVQYVTSRQLNNTRASQASTEHHPTVPETDRQQIPDSIVQQQNIVSNIAGVHVRDGNLETSTLSNPTVASTLPEMGPSNPVSQQHWQDSAPEQGGETRGSDRQEAAPRLGTNEGMFFSRVVHQLMPYISQITATEPSGATSARADTSERRVAPDSSTLSEENTIDIGTSHRRSDPPPPSPNSKRQKVWYNNKTSMGDTPGLTHRTRYGGCKIAY
ncbi:Ubiquitin domain [Macleaya cordata]|uniref:Ubiquitin domain n=1 Tax=Macleaya cordata TaxID=56857 RepID=A0A200PPY8_MACCD|nr:Ubiquitin domain [Macleaya cordata]